MSNRAPRWNLLGGLLIAGMTFLITRIYVAETVRLDASLVVGLASLPPLIVGLGLTVYGVTLAVGRFSPSYVRTVTIWYVIGTVGLLALLATTQLRSLLTNGMTATLTTSGVVVGNLLLGGAVVGVVIGDRSAANARKRREIQRTANRAAFVNRLLRHDVLNATAIIEGHADLLTETVDRPESVSAIANAAETVKQTITEVGRIASPNEDREVTTVALAPTLETVAEECRKANPDCEIRVDSVGDDVTVAADGRLDIVLRELVENAVRYGDNGSVRVAVNPSPQSVAISVVDNGSGLPADQRALLTTGEFPAYDDPSAGFGLQAVSLLVGRYGGRITTTGGDDNAGNVDSDTDGVSDGNDIDNADGGPHRITVRLPRQSVPGFVLDTTSIGGLAIARATTAGLGAGVLMGGVLQLTAGSLPVIGALYSVGHVGVGWITHLFHSVIFALLFATGSEYTDWGVSLSPPVRAAGVGLVWGTVLWFVAAGFVMPAWLRLLGQPATLPTLTVSGFLAHAVWGTALGWLYLLLGRSERFERFVCR